MDLGGDRRLWAQVGDLLAQRAAENDCTPAEYMDTVFDALGLDARAEDFTDVINHALRVSMEEFRR